MEKRFPVLITGTMQYVVWVDAEDAADAHQAIEENPYDWVENEQPVDASLSAETDPEETAHFIWVYGSSFMPQHDAHVITHRAELYRQEREAKQAACGAIGHPERETYADGPIWCKGCSQDLTAEPVK